MKLKIPKLIIAGSRDFIYYDLVKQAFTDLNIEVDEIVSGGARGADTLGELLASEINVPVKVFKADWDLYCKRAGFIRNREMAKYADGLMAISLNDSAGTNDMVKVMLELGKYTKLRRFTFN